MNDQNIDQVDQILLSFARLDDIKILEVISYDPSKALIAELIKIFDSEMIDKISLIKKNFAEENYSEVSRVAHRIRSTGLNLGTTRLCEILKRIEYQSLETLVVRSEIDFLIRSVEKEFLYASEKLKAYLPQGRIHE